MTRREQMIECAGAKNAPCFTAVNAGSSTHGRRITTFAATEKG